MPIVTGTVRTHARERARARVGKRERFRLFSLFGFDRCCRSKPIKYVHPREEADAIRLAVEPVMV